MEKRGVSRSELAKRLNVSRASISKLFNQGSNLTLKRMLQIAEALDCSLSLNISPDESAEEEAKNHKLPDTTRQ